MSTHHQTSFTPTSAAGVLHQQSQLEVLLHQIVFSARETIPGAEYAGLTIGWDPGKMETVAGTDPVVYQLDEIQYQLNEGPVVDAVNGRWETLAQDIPMKYRWPRFCTEAEKVGIASQIVRPINNLPGHVGVLTLYSSEHEAFDTDASMSRPFSSQPPPTPWPEPGSRLSWLTRSSPAKPSARPSGS